MQLFFYFKAVLKVFLDLIAKLIGAEGAKTPAGDPTGAVSAEEAPRTPDRPRTVRAWSGNQQLRLTEPIFK
jgi:hypothetical protein